jgi:LCP family protein required for cell wall assembly
VGDGVDRCAESVARALQCTARMTRWRWVAIGLLLLCLGSVHWLNARPYRRPLLVAAARHAPNPPLSAMPAQPAAAPVLPAAVVSASVPAPPPAASATTTPPFEYTDNFLLVGLDRRPFGGGPALSDTILVAVFDEPSGALGLISIPRDLWVEIPGHGEDRINTVMNVARRSGEDPLGLLGRVVENTLGLPIAHAMAIDLGVFERAVDALGGVTVDVPCPIIDRFIDPRDPTGYRKLDLPAGSVRLDGVTAAMYARSRHGRSDFSRARRQQAILVGMRHELSAPATLVRLPALFGQFEDSIETDLRRIEVLSLAERVLRVDKRHLHGLVLGVEVTTPFQTADGKAVLRPNPAAINSALVKLFSAPSPGLPERGSVCPKADIALGSG